MAVVGDILNAPETGWLQLNEDKIKYVGATWSDSLASSYADGAMKVTYTVGDYFEFSFVGVSFRLIGYMGNNRAKNIVLTIDGVSETISQYSEGTTSGVLMYEKLNLDSKLHTVKVQLNESAYFNIDRVDINKPLKKITIKNPITNQHYSLADKTLILLPDGSDETIIEHGIETGKEIKLDEDFDKIRYVQDTSETLGVGKVFKVSINSNNTKKITIDTKSD